MSSAAEPRPLVCFPVYPKQAAFLDATEPIRGFVGGQGCGKSKIGAYDLLTRAKPDRLYMVVAPTYPMLRDATLRTFREVARQVGLWINGPAGFLKTEFTARVRTLHGGTAEILFRSGENPDRLRGPNVSGLWMDEASLLKHEAFQIATARLREAGEQGWMSATFTPKGYGHWTYQVFGKPEPGVMLVQARTYDNPFLAPEFLDTVGHQFAGLRAKQELEGLFVSVEGAEFPPDWFDCPGFWFKTWPNDLMLKTMSCDPSMGADSHGSDYQAHILLGRGRDNYLYVDADLQRQDVDSMVQTGCELVRVFGPDGFALETNQFQSLLKPSYQRIARRIGLESLPLYPIVNTVNKKVRIRRLTPYLSQKRLRFKQGSPGVMLLVQQLRDFSGDRQEGVHDDGPDALEMAIRLMTQLWNGRAASR